MTNKTCYRIRCKDGGYYGGIREANSPARALLKAHRSMGFSEDEIWIEDGELQFADGYRAICGDVQDWSIKEVQQADALCLPGDQ